MIDEVRLDSIGDVVFHGGLPYSLRDLAEAHLCADNDGTPAGFWAAHVARFGGDDVAAVTTPIEECDSR